MLKRFFFFMEIFQRWKLYQNEVQTQNYINYLFTLYTNQMEAKTDVNRIY